MMKKMVSPAMVGVLALGLMVSGCATKQFVQEQVAASEQLTETKISEVQTSVEANQEKIGALETKSAQMEKDIAKLSATAKDALQRAEEAGKLAKGKFLYEVVLTDNDVTFGFNKYGLSDEAEAALDAFAQRIKSENKNVFVEIQGHTCNIGSDKANLELGYRRAEQAMRYLNMNHGFPLHRMNVITYGKTKPIADNSTKDGRAQNRRVALVVMH
jgi:peptidoglycan-associated lipoprotein